MTRDYLLRELAALEAHLDSRVQIVRVVIDGDGTVLRRIVTGSFQAPASWQPPSLESQLAKMKGTAHD